MKYNVETGPAAMTRVPAFTKNGPGIQKLMFWGPFTDTDSVEVA
jgi:hypothetical protein